MVFLIFKKANCKYEKSKSDINLPVLKINYNIAIQIIINGELIGELKSKKVL